MSAVDGLRQAVLDEIQSGFPLESHPYAAIAGRLGADAGAVVDAVAALRADGVIRRIGASFASAKLGFTSVLCALAVSGDEAEVDRVAGLVSAHAEVTHNYLRDDRYNLWFTVIARDEAARDAVLGRIVAETGCEDLLALPATALYKIRVDFGHAAREDDGFSTGAPFDPRDPFDVALVRWAQGDAEGVEPYSDAAAFVSGLLGGRAVDEDRVIERLRSWKADGTIRRFGAMTQHRRMGYLFNGMCVFDAPSQRIDELGGALAELPFVSHCYARPRSERWPYSLYAMVHAKTQGELDAHVAAMRGLTGLMPRVLVSSKEYKKVSPTYFGEALPEAGCRAIR